MKFILAALLGCLYLATVQAQNTHLHIHRDHLGHFGVEPFLPLYESYAATFIAPNYPDRAYDDWRNYAPSGDQCMNFFRQFSMDEYKLRDLDDFIVLDACLGYIYDGKEHHDDDSAESQFVRENLPLWQQDEKLNAIYHGTKLNEKPHEAQVCIGNLLYKSVQAKGQFKNVACNDKWLHVFLTFAECSSTITDREGDTYMEILFSLVKERANHCFLMEINNINVAVHMDYKNNPFQHLKNKVSWNPLKSQAVQRTWPKEVRRLLAAVQGTENQINLRRINGLIRGVALKHPNWTQTLLNNLAKFADKDVKTKDDRTYLSDPLGHKRYRESIDKLCNFFRKSDLEGYYDFSTPFLRMVRMLQYEDIFGISEKQFVHEILRKSYETAPLYLSVSSCNIISFTQGQFEHKAHVGEKNYKVTFQKDLSKMVLWPDAGTY